MASNYGSKNQYHPKASQELFDKKKAHTWQIKGNFDGKQGRLNIYIYDATTSKEYEQYFTQQSFQNLKLFDVAKKTIDAINTTMNGGIPMCTIQEWQGMAYLTIQGGQIPTLALPAKQQNQQQNQQQFGQQKKK
eukprot:CAMPEP_0201577098 /NCGR_PEP_ID=MMETSP0190_2-20130828/23322_1 /ASSEMBLY_ACC=CAM_ASM_000263 /TAXON_ID=37353 /ORGANISM="Rosalina sp." /LENGTH=133 /DNA_ID=CAMNT_0048008773 /DNA_START=5 /DNA_END=406 /DNA_ORIENTATION=-